MRLSFRRFVLSFYIVFCGTISILNLKYSSMPLQSEMATAPGNDSVAFSSAKQIPRTSAKEASPASYLGLINTAIRSANHTVYRLWATQSTTGKTVPRLEDETKPPPPALFPEDSLETDRILEQMNFRPKKLKPRDLLILLPRGLGTWHVKPGKGEFQLQNCPVQNCLLSNDKTRAVEADAILFRQNLENLFPDNQRRSEQIWIFYNLESPEHSGGYSAYRDKINWTATYRWDSDLVTPYERFTLNSQVPKDQGTALLDRRPVFKSRDFAFGKSKMVAWFVSHCGTINNREGYVRELAKYIQVDIYGSCGKLRCPRFDRRCDQMLDTDYKFYIAFENSNCRDYITEKYFINGLGRNTLPIVMGARKSDYARVSPPHSFIHVDDFPGPKELAAHLHFLHTNRTAYNQYFQWKGSGTFINTKFWCRLCALLNEPRAKVYPDVQRWWRSPDTCTRTSFNG